MTTNASTTAAPTWAPPLLESTRRADRCVAEAADVRRAFAIELALEAARAEEAGGSPDVVEALRAKARSVLGHRPGTCATPAPALLRRPSDELAVRVDGGLAVEMSDGLAVEMHDAHAAEMAMV